MSEQAVDGASVGTSVELSDCVDSSSISGARVDTSQASRETTSAGTSDRVGASGAGRDATTVGARQSRGKEVLQVLVTTLPIAGAVGTAFVWVAANFYVGDVEIVGDRQYQSLLVVVYDKKGQGTTFRMAKFQLMPGTYHVEVSADGKSKHAADIDVAFGKKNRVAISLVEPTQPNMAQASQSDAVNANRPDAAQAASRTDTAQAGRRRQAQPQEAGDTSAGGNTHHKWWQFWRKKSDKQTGE